MWNQLRREVQQRRQYLLVITLGCLVMLIGIITSLSSMRFSSSSNRFLGPILTFMGFTAILFGVRWRKSILFTEQRQVDLNMMNGEIPPNNAFHNQPGPPYIGRYSGGNYHPEMTYNTLPIDESKFLVAPAYSAPGFPAQPPPPFPSEPPPPYAPPSYETAAASSSVAPQMAPYPLNSTCTNVPADGTVPSTSSISQSAAAVHPGNAAVVHPATATDTLPTVS